jgi:hypothetical protein
MVSDGMTGVRRANPLLWSAAAGAAALLIGVGPLFWAGGEPGRGGGWGLADVLRFGLPLVVLVLLRWKPERMAPRLLVVAGVCAVPLPLVALAPGVHEPWMSDVLAFAAVSAAVLLLIGVLGAAVELARGGARGVAAALVGVAVVGPVLGPTVIFSTIGVRSTDAPALLALLLAVATAVSGVLALRGPAAPAARPVDALGWRVVLAGGVAAMTPVLYRMNLFNPHAQTSGTDPGDHLRMAALLGVIAVVAGAVAGVRAGLAAIAAGLLIGALQSMLYPTVVVLEQMPVAAGIAVVASLGIGCAAAASRWRYPVGVGGAGVVAAGLAVVLVLLAAGPTTDVRWITPVLLVVGVASAISLVAAIATGALGVGEDTPAVLTGLVVPVSIAVAHLASFGYLTIAAGTIAAGTAPQVGVLVPVVVAVLVAGGVGALVARERSV